MNPQELEKAETIKLKAEIKEIEDESYHRENQKGRS